jgi:hypothetical protein
VAIAHYKDGRKTVAYPTYITVENSPNSGGFFRFSPSDDWAQGGPLIEQEGIELLCNLSAHEASRFSGGVKADWQAFHRSNRRTSARQFAATPLIAAMRYYVASKLGDEVEVPDELA